jgi:hypothetical protein
MANWKLGKDMIPSDTILDPVTFDDLILALKCNCEYITPDAVIVQATEIINQRLEDVKYLVENNMDEIIAIAKDEPLENAGHDGITLEE